MKILQINANYGLGSTGLIMRDIGDAIVDSGHEAYYAFQKCSEVPLNAYIIGNTLDWKLHAILCRIFGRQGFYSKSSTKKFLKYLEQIRPDIVHVHNLHSNYIHIELLFNYLAEHDIATVITMHDCWYFTGKCFHYIDCGCERFKSGCGKCIKKSAPPVSIIRDTSAKDWKVKNEVLHRIRRLAIVGCSNWTAKEAQKSFLGDCTISCIYNGVDTTIFSPKQNNLREKLGLSNQAFIVMGMANKWMQECNVGIISKIMSIKGVTLMIVGCTETQKQQLRIVDDHVISVGFIRSREELATYYNAADVFINLTHADTLPTVNMEAICCGTPVVTYNSSGSPELVPIGMGIVVEENDQEGIIQAVKKLQKQTVSIDNTLAKAMYNKNDNYYKYLDVYQSLLHL